MLSKKYSLFDDDEHSNTLTQEWSKLAEQIRKYNVAYDEGRPMIRDEAYDALKRRLFEIEQVIGPQSKSPLYEVGSDYGRDKVQHLRPMLSLDHGFGVEAIHTFVKKLTNLKCQIFPLIAEYKIDGVAIAIRYDENFTVLTRGNGREGVNVTPQFEFVRIPKHLHREVEVRGELFMTFAEFAKLEYKFASPRNACAALIQSKTPLPWLNVEFGAYQCFGFEHNTYLELVEHLEKIGFKTPHRKICHNIEDCIEFFETTETARKNNSLSYPIDGIVLKLNEFHEWERLGFHATGPRYASAIKFTPSLSNTKIIDILPQVGKFGVITPVAVFEPVEIDGSVISRATLHNFEEVINKNYGIGDKVMISKAGDSVPFIHSKVYDACNRFDLINCPSCGSELVKFEQTLKCMKGWDCIDQKIGRIEHFCSRNGFNIMSLGRKRVEDFVKQGYLETPADIFTLESRIKSGEVVLGEGWKSKSLSNLISGINRSKAISFSSFLFALGIPNLGLGQANLIAKHFNSFEDFTKSYASEPPQIKGIGRTLIESIRVFLLAEKWSYKLLSAGVTLT